MGRPIELGFRVVATGTALFILDFTDRGQIALLARVTALGFLILAILALAWALSSRLRRHRSGREFTTSAAGNAGTHRI